MNNSLQQAQQNRMLAAIDTSSEQFDFEVWAKVVRDRMIEALQKRGSISSRSLSSRSLSSRSQS